MSGKKFPSPRGEKETRNQQPTTTQSGQITCDPKRPTSRVIDTVNLAIASGSGGEENRGLHLDFLLLCAISLPRQL
jgi:hypothetical protein